MLLSGSRRSHRFGKHCSAEFVQMTVCQNSHDVPSFIQCARRKGGRIMYYSSFHFPILNRERDEVTFIPTTHKQIPKINNPSTFLAILSSQSVHARVGATRCTRTNARDNLLRSLGGYSHTRKSEHFTLINRFVWSKCSRCIIISQGKCRVSVHRRQHYHTTLVIVNGISLWRGRNSNSFKMFGKQTHILTHM